MRYHLNFRDLDERTRYASLFHREACKLQKHLVDYKPDLIDVWGFMASLPRNAGYAARMRVHLPTGTLKAEGRGFTRFSAWTDVSAEMGVRIERHKARLPGSRSRHRKEHHERRWETLRRRPDPDVDSTVASSIQVGYPDLLELLLCGAGTLVVYSATGRTEQSDDATGTRDKGHSDEQTFAKLRRFLFVRV